MDKIDLRTLQILEEIGQDGQLSQRRLADRLGISLGLVNSFVKRLANKGYFKIINTPPNRFVYVLTPKGFAEKARLSYKYITYSYRFYRNARHQLRELFIELTGAGVGSVVFAGISDFAEIAYLSLQEVPVTLAGVVDDADGRHLFFGHVVRPVHEIAGFSYDRVLITDIEHHERLQTLLEQMGIARSRIRVP
ncbi:winged helix-turn-helix transcriptional regulator [Desulfosudis oleivorans]|uniref:Putative transcriptional regulator, AsnC family n=1 Tax=Desulfosudis oleivorans (strain DSM 6200 / JCM 39069 / Hxd3) TaxID=96561 RepID=A8ZY82_DESOH|nr:winged helix-turn-helix transcriptional regulator [Desulfosudis oleivorans]ABW67089.1 putative transcriptional regulator, AsnC family [Desulfosudis oleivorans Hxd3]